MPVGIWLAGSVLCHTDTSIGKSSTHNDGVMMMMMMIIIIIIHWTICTHAWLQVTVRYYERIPERAIYATGTTIMCDVPAIADGTVLANRPDSTAW